MAFFHFHPHPYTHLEVSLKYLFVSVYYQVLGILINLVTLSNSVALYVCLLGISSCYRLKSLMQCKQNVKTAMLNEGTVKPT